MFTVAKCRCLVIKSVLGISAITSSWAQGVSGSTGNIQGTVVSDSGAGLANATVALFPYSGPSRFSSTAVTSSMGAFAMKAIPAGRYNLCARPATPAYADSCLWGTPRLVLDVPAASGAPPIIIPLRRGSLLKVRLNDSAAFLAPLPSEKFPPHVLVGVWGPSRFVAAQAVRKDSSGIDFELPVPSDTPLRFRAYSRMVKLLIGANSPVAPQGYSTMLFFDSTKPAPPPLVLGAVGRLP